MNLKIKFRESFRPFAPVVLRERVSDYFEMPPETDSPYMMLVAPVREDRRARVNGEQPQGLDRVKMVRSEIPAVTHVDYSARCKPWTPAATGASTSWSRPSSENRLSRHHQHQLQRARRTNRLYAGAGTAVSWRPTWTRWWSTASSCSSRINLRREASTRTSTPGPFRLTDAADQSSSIGPLSPEFQPPLKPALVRDGRRRAGLVAP